MNVPILHIFPGNIVHLLMADPETMLLIAGFVLLAALAVGYFLYTDSKRTSKH